MAKGALLTGHSSDSNLGPMTSKERRSAARKMQFASLDGITANCLPRAARAVIPSLPVASKDGPLWHAGLPAADELELSMPSNGIAAEASRWGLHLATT